MASDIGTGVDAGMTIVKIIVGIGLNSNQLHRRLGQVRIRRGVPGNANESLTAGIPPAVLLADDQAIVRRGLRLILDTGRVASAGLDRAAAITGTAGASRG